MNDSNQGYSNYWGFYSCASCMISGFSKMVTACLSEVHCESVAYSLSVWKAFKAYLHMSVAMVQYWWPHHHLHTEISTLGCMYLQTLFCLVKPSPHGIVAESSCTASHCPAFAQAFPVPQLPFLLSPPNTKHPHSKSSFLIPEIFTTS